MSIFSIYADTDNFCRFRFDLDQMFDDYGSLPNHFDVNYTVRPYSDIVKRPFKLSFSDDGSGLHGNQIPEISEQYGRLFLNYKAYEVVKKILKSDGEFLPVTYELGEGFIFNPLHLAENVNGLDTQLSVKNEWGDIQNITFHADKVKGYIIFKTKFDNYISSFCQESLKEAIEGADLKGVFFTPDLGNPFSMKNNVRVNQSQ